MKKEELRIGNKIWFDNRYDEVEVITVTSEFFDKIDLKLSSHKPIPLTEEILIKAGFEIVNSYYSDGYTNPYVKFDKLEYKKSGFALEISEGKIVTLYLAYQQDARNLSQAYSDEFTNYEEREVVCEYVHQLQNIYYALLNTELTINL
ncbi:MAG TPA: hypothetical protein VL443_24470 [Cyclobacteriaceae bacterium]|jgi:hypothetical protein|nr:hypothetical protein [Cyclobacteriaceae bacterium]